MNKKYTIVNGYFVEMPEPHKEALFLRDVLWEFGITKVTEWPKPKDFKIKPSAEDADLTLFVHSHCGGGSYLLNGENVIMIPMDDFVDQWMTGSARSAIIREYLYGNLVQLIAKEGQDGKTRAVFTLCDIHSGMPEAKSVGMEAHWKFETGNFAPAPVLTLGQVSQIAMKLCDTDLFYF